MTSEKCCLLLLAYGGPRNISEVEGFISRVLSGKPSEEIIEANKKRYAAVGGCSPVVEDVSILGSKLKEKLPDFDVDWAFRFSEPFIKDVVVQKLKSGFRNFFIFTSTPFYSEWSFKGYLSPIKKAAEEEKVFSAKFYVASDFFLDEDYLESWLYEIKKFEPLNRFDEVIFTAHSLPLSDSAAQTVYSKQLNLFAEAVSEKAGIKSFRVAYQSKGRRGGDWLEPDVSYVVSNLKQGSNVLFIPAGFLQENIETLYDLDIEVKGICASRQINYHRVKTPFKNEAFIRFLAGLVRKDHFWLDFDVSRI